jgi:hypothetical protein
MVGARRTLEVAPAGIHHAVDEIMKALVYYASLLSAAPCVAFAAWVTTVNHVIEVRNVFVLFYHFLQAFGRGLPLVLLFLLILVVAGTFPSGRVIGAGTLLVLDAAAIWIILRSPAVPKSLGEAVFFLPVLVSIALAVFLLK